jgi:hypothetical protein
MNKLHVVAIFILVLVILNFSNCMGVKIMVPAKQSEFVLSLEA